MRGPLANTHTTRMLILLCNVRTFAGDLIKNIIIYTHIWYVYITYHHCTRVCALVAPRNVFTFFALQLCVRDNSTECLHRFYASSVL